MDEGGPRGGPWRRPFGFEGGPCGCGPDARGRAGSSPRFHAYPQANIYRNAEGQLVLEFALAGVDESSVKIGFQGDYLVLSARARHAPASTSRATSAAPTAPARSSARSTTSPRRTTSSPPPAPSSRPASSP
ncbi:MAG: hypothetical protein MZV70_10930 [Desulfobacterales bacterium]|nr:hypothetical protein [Desulfobacterales bacterium]